ncbi:MAG: hypothetical protein U9N44_04405 [Chloroflexota bacterium]|nr:hypothetical protein [Chloroflexota bacterium]
MVKELSRDNSTYYACEVCKCAYSEKEQAERCQKWCAEYHSCNIEIIKHRIDISAIEQEG